MKIKASENDRVWCLLLQKRKFTPLVSVRRQAEQLQKFHFVQITSNYKINRTISFLVSKRQLSLGGNQPF